MPRPRKSFDTAGVKSATRVMDVLEYFDLVKRSASVTELARELAIPQSSMSMLINSLIDRGYLTAVEGRRVQPTARVAMLGRWVDVWVTNGRISQLMHDLGETTGETVILGIASALHVVYIDVIPATKPMRLHIPRGMHRPIAKSGMGLLLLSAMTDVQIAEYVDRVTKAASADAVPPRLDDVMTEICEIRARGYALSASRIVPGAGIVCRLLPQTIREQPIAIGIGGQAAEIQDNAERFSRLLQDRITLHLGS